jgi:hypothetical protein
MNIDIAALKQSALAATPGPWESRVGACYDEVEVVDGPLICFAAIRGESKANARFIAAANPVAVLELIARLDQAEQREGELVDLLISARAIAERQGKDTAWSRFSQRIASFGIGCVTAKTFRILPSDREEDL